MFDSITGLVVGFILLASITGWNVIRTRGIVWFKVVSICLLLWYGLVVYFTVPEMMGWSTDRDLPENAKVISVRIIEPRGSDEGSMYFWLSQTPDIERDAINLLRPDKVFLYTGLTQPRAYKIPYDRELHKELIKKQKSKKKRKGSFLMTGKKGKKGKMGTKGSLSKERFKIVNPMDKLVKEDV